MKRVCFFLIAMLCVNMLYAQVGSEYDKMKKKYDDKLNSMKETQTQVQADFEKRYQDYLEAEKEARDKFIKRIGTMWGGDNVVETTSKDWVEYSDDGTSRSVVDFEEGEAVVEVMVSPEDNKSDEEIETLLEDKIKELIVSRGKTKDYDTPEEKALPLQETPVLENQIQTPSGEVVTEENIDESVKEIAQETVVERKVVVGDDGKKRQVVSVKLDLAPDHIRIRAEKYKKEVEKYCRKYNVDPAMAYAVMQTESSFNPKAKSHVPAYGLMQIVPSSAGQDCAQSLNKPFKKPTANYLYEPENNIEMGVHYLYLLKKRYYTRVENPRNRDLCVIASYNTGAGNVARALRGDTKISDAIPQINAMSYDELFKFFEKNLLPETQNYIRKVTERMNDFNKWMK